MKTVLTLLFSLLVFLPAPLRAAGPIVAVFELEDKGSGLAPEVLGNLSDYLGVLLTKGGYRVMPRTEIRDRLKEQKKETYRSCYDQSCQIELGRELAAEKTLATWVLKIGKTCQVTATLYDLKKGTTELAAAHEAPCDEENLVAASKKVEELEKTRRTADTQELEKARAEARQAQKRAEKERKLAEAAKLEAEKKAAEARREAEEARKHPEGRPTESFNVGIKLTAIAPDVTEMTIDHHEEGERTGTFQGGFGVTLDADFMIASFLSAGARLAYGQGEYRDPDDPNEDNEYLTLHIMSVYASLKGRLNLGWVEFRPGIATGYHHLNGSAAGKVHGLGLSAFVETAFYLGRHFALTIDLNMNIMPVASGNEGDQTYTIPLLLLSLGAEYCD